LYVTAVNSRVRVTPARSLMSDAGRKATSNDSDTMLKSITATFHT
jgi:hypothetical protein